MINSSEPKKSFWMIYTAVAVFYAIMIIVYSFVVHNATLDGAQDVLPKTEMPVPEALEPMPAATDNLLL